MPAEKKINLEDAASAVALAVRLINAYRLNTGDIMDAGDTVRELQELEDQIILQIQHESPRP